MYRITNACWWPQQKPLGFNKVFCYIHYTGKHVQILVPGNHTYTTDAVFSEWKHWSFPLKAELQFVSSVFLC